MSNSGVNGEIEVVENPHYEFNGSGLFIVQGFDGFDEFVGSTSGVKKFGDYDIMEHPERPLTFMNKSGKKENLRGLKLLIGGRWELMEDDEKIINFKTPAIRYIYHINPDDFSLGRLMSLVTRLRCWRHCTQIWYQEWGKPYHKSIQPLCNNEHMDQMWVNMEAFNKNFTTIYFQDVDRVMTDEDFNERGRPSYDLPRIVPSMTSQFDVDYYLEIGEMYQEQNAALGCHLVGEQELMGMRPYITTQEEAGNILDPNILLLPQRVFQYSRLD